MCINPLFTVYIHSIPSQMKSSGDYNLDIIVENLGRVNYIDAENKVPLESRKGILRPVTIDNKEKEDWLAYSFEFTQTFVGK